VLLEIFKTNLALQHAVEGGEVLDIAESGTVTEHTPGEDAAGAAAGGGDGPFVDERGAGAAPGDNGAGPAERNR
jgi:hypothetical protein